MDKLLSVVHETMITEIITKGLITCKLLNISQPVTLYAVAVDLPNLLQNLLSQPDVYVHKDVTIPTFVEGEIKMLNYSHQEVLDGNFTVQSQND